MLSTSSRAVRVTALGRNVAVYGLLTCVCGVDVALAGHAPLVPEPRTILLRDGAPEHVVVGTRRGGYFVTKDAGNSWSWLCEAGIGYEDEDVYPGALLPSGTLVLSTGFGGLASSRDGCSFTPWLPSEQPFVADVRVRAQGRAVSVVALETRAQGASFVNQLWASGDDAATWQELGAPFADEERATSFALDGDGRIFVGTTDSAGAALWRLDAAASRPERVALTDDADVVPRVIGVSGAGDTARVFVVLDYEQVEDLTTRGDVALLSIDGGVGFSPWFVASGDLPAAALSADGRLFAIGGEDTGIRLLDEAHAATADAKPLEVSNLEAHALAWDADGRLYAAGHEAEDGFSVGVSADDGRTFEPLFALCQVEGPLDCASDTSVGGLCLASGETGWDVRKEVAESHACDGGHAGAAGAPHDEHDSPSSAQSPADHGQSGCSFAPSRPSALAAVLGVSLAHLAARMRRRRRRARD